MCSAMIYKHPLWSVSAFSVFNFCHYALLCTKERGCAPLLFRLLPFSGLAAVFSLFGMGRNHGFAPAVCSTIVAVFTGFHDRPASFPASPMRHRASGVHNTGRNFLSASICLHSNTICTVLGVLGFLRSNNLHSIFLNNLRSIRTAPTPNGQGGAVLRRLVSTFLSKCRQAVYL